MKAHYPRNRPMRFQLRVPDVGRNRKDTVIYVRVAIVVAKTSAA